MDWTLKQNRQIRLMGLSLGTSILAAVATMFVPASVLESITGASGLSELVPATAAPLGDTARALIAFAAGALTLSFMAAALLRQNNVSPPRNAVTPAADLIEEDDRVFASSLKERISKIGLPKMPWIKGDDDITELSDLPRLRVGDIHPDAPARRPLSAIVDLPVLDLTERALEPAPPKVDVIEPIEPVETVETVEPVEPVEQDELSEPVTPVEPEPVAELAEAEAQPTLAEMVAQLEASVAQRQRQLAELEVVATNLASARTGHSPNPVGETEISGAAIESEEPAEVLRPEWRPLGMVPKPLDNSDDTDEPDEMDEALAAALATLHRMNGTGR